MDETKEKDKVAKKRVGRPRKRRRSPRRSKRAVANSRAARERYKDPVQKARNAIQVARMVAERKVTKIGVPMGWTRVKAELQRAYDGIRADLLLDRMKAEGMVDQTKPGDFETLLVEVNGKPVEVRVPKTEAGMAEAALREAVIGAISPLTQARDKPTYLRMVLEWTKPKPATTSNVNLGSEEWLEAALKDNNGDRAGEDSAP